MANTARSHRYRLVDDKEVEALRAIAEERMQDLQWRASEMRRQGGDLGASMGGLENRVLDLYEAEIRRIGSLLNATEPC